jgi:short-subunit dehydrogenase
MHDGSKKVILITGTSSGIGESCANYLYDLGHKVYGVSRSPHFNPKFKWIKMDITDDTEVSSVVNYIVDQEGRIDVLVNNAGIHLAGAIEEISIKEAKQQFDTNFFGTLNLIRCVLPYMRNQKNGLIINISSIGGLMGLPFQGMYCASKFAIEGLTESLRMELKQTGIHTTLILPGDTCTPITRHRTKNISTLKSKNYALSFYRTMNVIEKDECLGTDPIEIAKLIDKLIHLKSIRVRYIIGKLSERLAVMLKKILPADFFELILIKKYLL